MADDYWTAFGGGSALANALRVANAPNPLAGGQVSTGDVIDAIPRPSPSAGLLEALRDRAMRGDSGAANLLAQDTQAKASAPWWSSEGLAASKPNAMGDALSRIPSEVMFLTNFLGPGPKRIPNPIKAYHGSPHDFDAFRMDKIGAGEGAQAYGHGLYFSEKPEVARAYEGALASNGYDPAVIARDALEASARDPHAALKRLERETPPPIGVPELDMVIDNYKLAKDVLTRHASGEPMPLPERGRMYEVAIHATTDQFLDWDKPLSQQSEAVRSRVLGALPEQNRSYFEKWAQDPEVTARDVYESMGSVLSPGDGKAHASPKVASALNDQGIPGIRYLDQGSRGAGNGTSNFVVFDPALIEILRKYGLAGSLGAGTVANALLSDNQDQ